MMVVQNDLFARSVYGTAAGVQLPANSVDYRVNYCVGMGTVGELSRWVGGTCGKPLARNTHIFPQLCPHLLITNMKRHCENAI